MRHFHLTTLILIYCYCPLSAQVRLNVAGDARVTGSVIELIKPGNTAHQLNLSSSGAAMDINATTDLYINSGGNLNLDANNPTGRIGVGTAAPASKFHVVGDAIRLSTPGNENRYLILRTDGGALDLSPVGAPLYIDPGGYNLLLATQTGHVGIGTETPAKKLSVIGDTQIQGRLELFRSPGDSSLFIGINAGLNDDGTNNDNTFIGTHTGISNTSGYFNTFLGAKAGDSNTTGFSNTFLGALSGATNTEGEDNAFLGTLAGFSNSLGSLNTFLGTLAGFSNQSGSRNTFVGKAAGYSNDFGINNAFFGMDAGFANTSGSNNVAIGNSALHSNTDRSGLVAVGDSTLSNNGLNSTSNNHATDNTALGSRAGFSNTWGWQNTFIGAQAGYANQGGIYNTFSGAYAGYSNQDGIYNTFLGKGAGYSNTSGDYNTFLGVSAGSQTQTGTANTFLGRGAAGINKTGSFNVSVGHLTTFSSDNLDYATAIGAAAVSNANNKTVIGRNTTGVVIGGYAAWSNLSDGRFKEDIEENVPGLEFIRRLRPVTYWVNLDKLQRHITAQMPDTIAARYLPKTEELAKAKQEIRTGFVAQEVEAVAKRIGYDFDGVYAPKNPTDNYSIAYSQFVPSLVKATQEQEQEIESVKNDNAVLRKENETLKSRMDELEGLVSRLLAQNQEPETTHSQTIQLRAEAQLFQNRPNPFGEETVIPYYIPEGTTKAQLRISAPDGKVLRLVDISGRGPGQTVVQIEGPAAGAYAYSLLLDGRVFETRQLVIQR